MNSDICQDNYVTVFTLDNPCYYYTCTPRYNFNWKNAAISFITISIVLLVGFLLLIGFLPKYNAVAPIDVEANVEEAEEANEIENGLENFYNVDLNNFGDD